MSEAEERKKRRAANNAKDRNNGDQERGGAEAEEMVSAPAHGGGKGAGVGADGGDGAAVKLDVFATLRYVARSEASRVGCTTFPPSTTGETSMYWYVYIGDS